MFICFDINVVKICTFCHENFKKRKHGNMGIINEIGPSQVLWLDLNLETLWYESFKCRYGLPLTHYKGFYTL